MNKWERIVVYPLFIITFSLMIYSFSSRPASDSKKAIGEAVKKLADEQHAAASYLEALGAYSPEKVREALSNIRNVQANFGVPYETAKQILEFQQRSFGEINPDSTKQFAMFWALHGQNTESTVKLIRWMGASDITDPERQGYLIRLMAAASKQYHLKNEEIINALSSYGSRFRYQGWSPEKTVENLAKVLVPGEDVNKTTELLLSGLEGFTDEKAHELGMPQ